MADLNEALDEAVERLELLAGEVSEATQQVEVLGSRTDVIAERVAAAAESTHEGTEALLEELVAAGEDVRVQGLSVREAVGQLQERAVAMSGETTSALADIRHELDALLSLHDQVKVELAASATDLDGRVDSLEQQAQHLEAMATERLLALRADAEALRDHVGGLHQALATASTEVHAQMESLAVETRARTDELVAGYAAFAQEARSEVDHFRANADSVAREHVDRVVEAFAGDAALRLSESLGPLQAALDQFEDWRDRSEALFEDRFGEAADRLRDVSNVVEALKPLLDAARVLS